MVVDTTLKALAAVRIDVIKPALAMLDTRALLASWAEALVRFAAVVVKLAADPAIKI